MIHTGAFQQLLALSFGSHRRVLLFGLNTGVTHTNHPKKSDKLDTNYVQCTACFGGILGFAILGTLVK